VRHFVFEGDREAVRMQAVEEALKLILEQNK
jgi:nicotinamide mononucleotide (NMN) deamidase PncC